jgi:chromosome segregation ATPase
MNATAITSSIQEAHSQFSAELRIIQDRIDGYTASVKDISTQQKDLTTQIERITLRKRERDEKRQKIENLRRAVSEMRESRRSNSNPQGVRLGDADRELGGEARARYAAYASLNGRLSGHLAGLRARDGELEVKYRRVIALCTGVPEESVDGVLGQLVQAVESEGDVGSGGQDVGRVREFLRRVEMVI